MKFKKLLLTVAILFSSLSFAAPTFEEVLGDDGPSINWQKLDSVVAYLTDLGTDFQKGCVRVAGGGATFCKRLLLSAPGMAVRVWRFDGTIENVRTQIMHPMADLMIAGKKANMTTEEIDNHTIELLLFRVEAMAKLSRSLKDIGVDFAEKTAKGILKLAWKKAKTPEPQTPSVKPPVWRIVKAFIVGLKNAESDDMLSFNDKMIVVMKDIYSRFDEEVIVDLGLDRVWQALQYRPNANLSHE